MSKWLQWRRDRFNGKAGVPDWFVDDDGTFYCDHGPVSSAQPCGSLAEHRAHTAQREEAAA